MKKYILTEKHKKKLKPWSDKWIANAMSTKAMDAEDRKITKAAIEGMYSAAGKEKPVVVFVSSPFVAAFATGFASAIWYKRANPELKLGVSATYAATDDATGAQDRSKWYVVNGNMTRLAGEIGVGKFGLDCAARSWNVRQGGNQWSGWDAMISFFRHVAGLGDSHKVDYAAWSHWEDASLHSGPRYMHEKFCIVSDRPEILKIDDRNRPHCEDGPFCKWRDGSALYAWHGTRVPAEWIDNRANLDPKLALTHENVEMRRVLAEMIGWNKVLQHANATVVQKDNDPEIGTLLKVDLPDAPGSMSLQVKCGTKRDFCLPVPENMKTAREANAWTFGIEPDELELEVRT